MNKIKIYNFDMLLALAITFLVIVLLLGKVLFSPSFVGRAGERFMANKLILLDRSDYATLNNLLLKSSGRTPTTQIDHVVVSIYGVFCIETKSYGGWIFGSVNNEYWTQVLAHGRRKYRLYNPLRQNYAHIKALESVIGEDLKQAIVSLIAFPDAERLKINGTEDVGNGRYIIEKIKSYNYPIYTHQEIQLIIDKIAIANIIDEESRKQHVIDVKNLKAPS